MAIIGNKYIDLIDIYKRSDKFGNMLPIIEMLMQFNPILEDAVAIECNMQTSHLHTIRTGLPSVAWGMLYKGIPQSKSQTVQVRDTTGFVEGLSTVDDRLLKIAKNEGAIRLSEAMAFIEAMSQEVAYKMFYGNTNSDPEQFMGLAPRFNDPTAPNGNQIVNAGGEGEDNTSIWIVTWGDNTVHTLYPEGTAAGVTREDKGAQRVLDADGNPFYVKEELFRQHIGLAVKDWRYVSRVCNIDINALHDGSLNIYDYLRTAYYRLRNRQAPMGKIAMYCNRDVLEALDKIATNAGANDNFVRLSTKELEGREIKSYRGIPVRECEALLNTEELVEGFPEAS